MSYEPVAWMQTWQNQDGELKHTVNIEQIGKNDIPLYTHPAKFKELTDVEIRTIQDMCHLKNVGYNTFIMRFARAILRKAGER